MWSTEVASQLRKHLPRSTRPKLVNFHTYVLTCLIKLNDILMLSWGFTEKLSKNWEQQARQRRMNYENPRIIDVQNYRYFYIYNTHNIFTCILCLSTDLVLITLSSIFVATWNVAGRSPPSDLNLDEWLHSSAPADIYVLGYVSKNIILFL